MPPIGVDEILTQDIHHTMLDLSMSITKKVNIFHLFFRKDNGFWDVLDNNIN